MDKEEIAKQTPHPLEPIDDVRFNANLEQLAVRLPTILSLALKHHRILDRHHWQNLGIHQLFSPENQLKRFSLWLSQSSLLSLVILSFGYGCFGSLLGLHHAHALAWLLTWTTVLIGLIDSTWIRFVPILGAIVTMSFVSFSASVILSVAIASIFACGLLWLCGSLLTWKFRKIFRNSLWLAGLFFITSQIATWLFYGKAAFSQNNFYSALEAPHFVVLLLLGIISVGRGAIATLQLTAQFTQAAHPLEAVHLSQAKLKLPAIAQQKIAQTLGLATLIGLSIGGIVGTVLNYIIAI